MRHPFLSLNGTLVLLAAMSAARAESVIPWATGAALSERLAAPVSVSWKQVPLARALASLRETQHVAIVLDRRIDPGQPVTLALDGEPLSEALATIAGRADAGYCQLGPIAYLGPPEMARRMRTLAALVLDEVRLLPQAATRKLLVLRDWQWDELAEPRALVDELAAEADVKIVGADKFPHDLWPAADLPPLTWIDRLTLLAAQFDLTYHVDRDGKTVRLKPAPDKVALVKTYRAGRDAANVVRRWSKAFPQATVTAEPGRIRVAATVEDHEQIERRMRAAPNERTTVTAGPEVYQLAVEKAALSRVMEQLAERLQLRVEWDRAAIDAAGISTEQLVSVKVQNVGLDELLRAVLKDTGLEFRREAQTVTIAPSAKRAIE